MTNVVTATLAAYEQWAPVYPPLAHNPLMRAEQAAMLRLWPDITGLRALDLACGTGRYAGLLREGGAAHVVGLDFCAPMLKQASGIARVQASMMCLPFAGGAFDVVVSGLAVGHATSIQAWMNEAARVLGKGGRLLYSDFHPEAARAGLPRSFKDADNRIRIVPHQCYDLECQEEAANAAGLVIEAVHAVRVGVDLVESFTNSDDFYRRWQGLPIVLVVRARK